MTAFFKDVSMSSLEPSFNSMSHCLYARVAASSVSNGLVFASASRANHTHIPFQGTVRLYADENCAPIAVLQDILMTTSRRGRHSTDLALCLLWKDLRPPLTADLQTRMLVLYWRD